MSGVVFIGNNYCPWGMIEGQSLCHNVFANFTTLLKADAIVHTTDTKRRLVCALTGLIPLVQETC